MSDDLLQSLVDGARSDLERGLAPFPPDFEGLRRRARSRRRGLLATGAAVLLVAAFAIVRDASPERQALMAGPPLSGSNGELLAPGKTRRLAPSPLSGRSTMASVWTGTEMLVWGGEGPRGQVGDGAAYDPRRDIWRMLPQGPLTKRNAPAAVWTGAEMLLWGGHATGVDHADGAAFDPVSGRWRPIADAPMRSGGRPVGLWTGREMVVVAGFNGLDVAAYDPSTDSWRKLPDLPGQMQAPNPMAVWTGSRLVVVLGAPTDRRPRIFSLDIEGRAWTELPPLGEGQVQLAWTGDGLLATLGSVAAVLEPASGAWTRVAQAPKDLRRGDEVIAWTGDQLVLWGGGAEASVIDPERRTWRITPAGGLKPRPQPASVWADGVFLAWGGFPDRADGVMMRPTGSTTLGPPASELTPPSVLPPRLVPVLGPNGQTKGTIDMNNPGSSWNGSALGVSRVEDERGNLVGYFGCRFFERSEVEREDFSASSACPSGQTTEAAPSGPPPPRSP